MNNLLHKHYKPAPMGTVLQMMMMIIVVVVMKVVDGLTFSIIVLTQMIPSHRFLPTKLPAVILFVPLYAHSFIHSFTLTHSLIAPFSRYVSRGGLSLQMDYEYIRHHVHLCRTGPLGVYSRLCGPQPED